MKMQISTLGSIVIPIAISTVGLLLVALTAISLQNDTIPLWTISKNRDLNFTFTLQLIELSISLVALLLIYLYNRKNVKAFFNLKTGLGNISSSKERNWQFLGPLVAIGFTLGTMSFMSVSVMSQHGQINQSFYKLIPWVLLFATTNSWSEEILSRFVIVAGLHGKFRPGIICWISAIIFGFGHFFGTPNGIFGVIASGFLGWFLAKSVVETKGLGWAWFIHFLQDVVIFGAGAMIIAGQH